MLVNQWVGRTRPAAKQMAVRQVEWMKKSDLAPDVCRTAQALPGRVRPTDYKDMIMHSILLVGRHGETPCVASLSHCASHNWISEAFLPHSEPLAQALALPQWKLDR